GLSRHRRRRRASRVSAPAAPVLRVESLEVSYGAIAALRGVDFEVGAGEIAARIGSNGAGKSTLLRAISGLLRPRAGRIWFEGIDITAERADRRVARGISQVAAGTRSSPRAAASLPA